MAGGPVEIGLLGPFELRVAGRLVRSGGVKQRALLALLALRVGRVVGRERLIDELWRVAPETAAKAVQVYVSRLRKVLPEGVLASRARGYVLELGPEAVDALRFERLVEEARGAQPARASELLGEALASWRGQALADLGDEPFVRGERGRLEELRLAAVENRIEAELALGRHAAVVGELEVLVAEHPHRERLRGLSMLALYRSGRQADALAAYRGARAALAELGLEPGGELRRLERRILEQDPELELRGEGVVVEHAVLPGPLAPAPPFPFVGRERELERLRTLLGRAEAGEGGMIALGGEAGSGKTRLLRELASEAAGRGVLVVYGVSDAAVTTPYQPVREWIEFLLRMGDPGVLRECLGDGGPRLARLVPELERLTGPPAPPTGEPETDRFVLQSALTGLLRRLGERQPALVLIDDLHWADSESLHLLRRLARLAPEGRLLVAAAYRDRGERERPALADALADLSRLDGVTRLALRGLSDEEMGAFVRASTEARPSAELVAAIGALTGGTPLLVCELWRDLRERGELELGDSARLAQAVARLHGPERIRDVVRQRLSQLAPGVTAAVELAAVAGPVFELGVLADAGGLEQAELVSVVEACVHAGIVEELPGSVPSCRFSHELVRRAVYEQLSRIHRTELHGRIGEALERVHGRELDRFLPELAYHFTRAVPEAAPERAVAYNLQAAQAAVASAAYQEAAANLETALDLGIADPHVRARAQVELAHLLFDTRRVTEAEAMTAAALDAATGPQERGIASRALVQQLAVGVFADPELDPAEVEPAARSAIATLRELGDAGGLALAERLLGVSIWRRGRAADALVELERALVDADASGEHMPLRQVVPTLAGTVCDGPLPVVRVIARCQELLEAYESDQVLGAVVTRFLAFLHAQAGRSAEARDGLARSSLVLDQLESWVQAWVYRRVAAHTKELLGDLAGAEQEQSAKWRALQDARGGALNAQAMQAVYELGLLYCTHGRWEDAEGCLVYGREVSEPAFYRLEAVLRLALEARVAAHRGAADDAVRLARRAVERIDGSDLLNWRARLWRVRAEVERDAGREAEAADAAARALELYEAKGNIAAAAQLRASAESC